MTKAPTPFNTFTRSEIADLVKTEPQLLEYWTKLGILRAEGIAEGKGRHRRFTEDQVILALFLVRLVALGFATASFKPMVPPLHDAQAFFRNHGLIGHEPEAEILIGLNRKCTKNNGLSRTDVSMWRGDQGRKVLQAVSRGMPMGGRKLNWDQFVELLQDFHGEEAFSSDLIQQCSNIQISDWHTHCYNYFMLCGRKIADIYVDKLFIAQDPNGEYQLAQNERDPSWDTYVVLDIASIKEKYRQLRG